MDRAANVALPAVAIGYVKSQKTFERVELIIPAGYAGEALKAMHDDGWRTVYLGPYTTKKMWPKHDMKRRKIIMEIELE